MKLFENDLRYLSPSFILRLGVGFVLVYAAIGSLLEPEAWLGFVPHWVSTIIAPATFLLIFSVFELILGFAIFFERFLTTASLLAFWVLIFILIFYGVNDITFRDFGLALASLALFFISLRERENKPH